MNEMYLLLNSANAPLARGEMLSPPGAEVIALRVQDGGAETVAEHEVINLIPMNAGNPSLQCQLLRQRGERIELRRMSVLAPELRRELRTPVRFDTFLYPVSGQWKGRRAVRSIDLSCGGIAFYGETGLEVGEVAEVVIPITDGPLIVHIKLLRLQELKNGRTYYAAKFVDIITDEEDLICEAVFSVQLHNRPQATDGKED